MLKFVFLLTAWHANAPADVYVMDYGLTGEDCIERVEAYVKAHPQYTSMPSCEPDEGQDWGNLPTNGYFGEAQ